MLKRRSVIAARNAIQKSKRFIDSNWPNFFGAVDECFETKRNGGNWIHPAGTSERETEEGKVLCSILFEQCVKDFSLDYQRNMHPGIAWKKLVPVDLAHLCLAWSRSPVVLEFDKRLTEALQSSTVDRGVDLSEYLRRMPFSCFFVSSEHLRFRCTNPDTKTRKAKGFFVDSSWAPNPLCRDGMEQNLTITILGSNDITVPVVIPLSCMNFDELCRLIVSDYIQAMGRKKTSAQRDMEEDMRTILGILLYVASQEPDIESIMNEEDEITEKRSNCREAKDVNSDMHVEVPRVFYVGKKVGPSIAFDNANIQQVSDSRKMTPHIRRAHFHTYVMGSRKEGTQKRVLKWLEPMRINMDNKVEPIIMVRKVDSADD